MKRDEKETLLSSACWIFSWLRRKLCPAAKQAEEKVAEKYAGIPMTDKLPDNFVFPHDFVWGTGTSAYQVEGAWNADGKGASIWDTFSHTPGKVANDENGDIACNQYHRFAADIELAKSLNLNAYRFSISWPRVQPGGRGEFNEAGMDFYDRKIDALIAAGLQPYVTLYHWDLPQELQDIGGWANREVCQLFADFAAKMVERYSNRVKFWTTFNEPWCTTFLGYAWGVHAPGLRDDKIAAQVAHNLLLAHGMACISSRAAAKKPIELGIVLNLTITEPLHADNPEDIALAEAGWRKDCGYYLDPLIKGVYGPGVAKDIGEIEPGDLAIINQKMDYLGINYYMRNVASQSPVVAPIDGHEYTQMGWEVYAPALRNLLTRIDLDYGHDGLPKMYVTENGAAFEDKLVDGVIDDARRLDYIRTHLEQVGLAIADGADVQGYFAWSLLDNFEWAEGYARRFGIIHVDFETQERTVKNSGKWLAKVAAANKLSVK